MLAVYLWQRYNAKQAVAVTYKSLSLSLPQILYQIDLFLQEQHHDCGG